MRDVQDASANLFDPEALAKEEVKQLAQQVLCFAMASNRVDSMSSTLFEVKRDDFLSHEEEDHAVTAKYRRLAEDLYGENDDNRASKTNELKERLGSTSPELLRHLPGNDDDAFLLKLLRSGGFDVDEAARMLRCYVKLLTTGPKYFQHAFSKNLAVVKESFRQQVL